MRYAYRDLGEQRKGATVVVRWGGGAADVMLLDPVNFTKYREAAAPIVKYGAGGHAARPPAELTVPEDGRWYVVADLRGYSQFAEATVEMPEPDSDNRVRQEHLIDAA